MQKIDRLNTQSDVDAVTLLNIKLKVSDRQEIERHTEEFLASGGEIKVLSSEKRTHIRLDPCRRAVKP